MCEVGIKTNIRPLEFYRAETVPPGFEIPLKFEVLDPPLTVLSTTTVMYYKTTSTLLLNENV